MFHLLRSSRQMTSSRYLNCLATFVWFLPLSITSFASLHVFVHQLSHLEEVEVQDKICPLSDIIWVDVRAIACEENRSLPILLARTGFVLAKYLGIRKDQRSG